MKRTILLPAVALLALTLGCASKHQAGVKSNYHSQWTKVAANTADTTTAAQAVLESHSLKGVKASSTAMDGVAKGEMADGTNVKVDVKKVDATNSEVDVTIGALGNPKLGAEIASEIKAKAEMK